MYWIIEFGVNVLEEVFQFQEWQVKIKRKFFRRGMTLSVYPNQKILVTTGLSVPHREIAFFLNTKVQWIHKHSQKFEARAQQIKTQSYTPGALFPFLGQEFRFQKVPTPLDRYFFSISPPYLNFHIPFGLLKQENLHTQEAWIKGEVHRLYMKEAEKYLLERTAFWSQKTQLIPSAISFRTQKSRWGSCSSNGKISLNLKLIIFSPEIIDYVIVHELCHLQEMNHSKKFWNLVLHWIPNHKALSKTLKEQQWKTFFLEP